ncbi:MAG: hypothetical protein QOD93_4648 [Acetobacteraceae bacterium]|jgi:uncharacterized protein YbjT (DUF2867 family)|nr:hypothetical protein [Acetobacteraceae bacterium]
MFAVTGATGKVGGAVARALLAAGRSVRVVVRDPGKAGVWSSRGCDVAIAETSDAAALARAFAGVEGAFVMLPSNFDPSPGFPEAKALIAALRTSLLQAAPAKIVMLSTIGAEATQPNLLNQLGLLEQALADLPMPISFLRAAWFMENAALDVSSAQESGVIHSYLQPLDKPFPMIATEDVGRTAAELLLETWNGHRVVELEGPRRVTPNDLAEAFAKALGWPVKAEIASRDGWEALFRQRGMQNPTPRMQMLDGFNAGWIDFPRQGTQARRGIVTIDQVIATLAARQPQP